MFIELVEAMPQLMGSLKGLDGRYRYVNSGFGLRVGREPSSIIGSTVHDLFAGDLAQSYASQDESVLTSALLASRAHRASRWLPRVVCDEQVDDRARR